MNDLLCRILRSVILTPLAIGLFVVLLIVIGEVFRLRQEFGLIWAVIFTAAFVVFYWLGTWRHTVHWTPRRKIMTVFSIALLIGLLALPLIDANPSRRRPWREIMVIVGLLGIPLWLAVTVAIWRETPAERVQRLQASSGKALFCPKCGYNMTGLYESRCPECGERFTLDQLLAAQQRYRIEDIIPHEQPKETATTPDPNA